MAFPLAPTWWRREWLPLTAAGCLWLALAAVSFSPGLWDTARSIVPWMIRPLFHDLHVARLGWQAVAVGDDPLANPANPFNYPRFVLAAEWFGVLRVPVTFLGLGLAAGFLASVVAALRARRALAPLVAAALVLSPPVILMVERGNLDAIAFMLVVGALALLHRAESTPWAEVGAAVALVLAAMLKLYPAAALVVALICWRRRGRWWFLAGVALWLGWCVLNAGEVALVVRKTTRGLEPAYGAALAASRWYLERVAPAMPGDAARAWLARTVRLSLLWYAVGIVIALAIGWRRRRAFRSESPSATTVVAFASGTAIYAGTFALGTNWSYRLVFLLLCAPLLWQLTRVRACRSWAVAAFAGVAIVLFVPFHLPLPLFFAVQAVSWLTAWLLVAVAAAFVRQA